MPATSYPTAHGNLGEPGYRPCRASKSEKLMPAACTRIRTVPGCTTGSGASRTSSTSGGPRRAMTTCLTVAKLACAALACVFALVSGRLVVRAYLRRLCVCCLDVQYLVG